MSKVLILDYLLNRKNLAKREEENRFLRTKKNVYIPLSAVAGTAIMAQAPPAFTTGDEPVASSLFSYPPLLKFSAKR